MADLVDKFYSADLNEAEEEALDGLLASSPETAEKFAQKAAEAYARYGLPEQGPSKGPGKGWRRGLGLLALALVLSSGYGLWRAVREAGTATTRNLPSLQPNELEPPAPGKFSHSVTTGTAPSPKTSNSKQLSAQGTDLGPRSATGPTDSLSSDPPAAGSVQTASSSLPGQVAASNGMSPLQASAPATRARSRLKINLAIGQSGPVTVRILDSSGADVQDLYSGNLAAGTYSFAWDGRLDSGKTAPPGQYQIESRDGSTVQTQAFWIQPKKRTGP